MQSRRRTDFYQGQFLQRRIAPAAIALAVIVVIAVAGYILIERLSFVDALYMTVITLSTVGFREVVNLSPAGRVFTIGIILTGVSTLGYAAATLVEYLVGGHLVARFAQRRKEQALASPGGHYIVCGYGRVGSRVAVDLRDEGRHVLVVDPDDGQCRRAEVDGFTTVRGDSASNEALTGAGIERAAGILIATGNDAENVYAVLAVRVMAPGIPIVARASSEEAVVRLRRAGATQVFSPYAEGAASMATYVLRPHVATIVAELLDPRSTRFAMEEFSVGAHSALVGRTLSDIRPDTTYGAAVISLVRGGVNEGIPSGEVVLAAGDIVIAVGDPVSLLRFAAACDTAPAVQRRVTPTAGD